MAPTDEARPDPKPAARVRLPSRQYLELVEQVILSAFGACECGCGRRAESVHHVVPRSQGGGDVRENLMAIAGDGTRLCHGALEDRRRTWDPVRQLYIDPDLVRRGLRLRMEAAEGWGALRGDVRAYVIEVKGEAWLERRYPM